MYHLHTFSCTYFYSHPREGGDIEDSNFVERQYISIHAPAKGATCMISTFFGRKFHFYSRPREGGDYVNLTEILHLIHFYSRPREGGDVVAMLWKYWYWISIHAPAKGATDYHAWVLVKTKISIHAPAKGATLFLVNKKALPFLFLFTPPRRGRLYNSYFPIFPDYFYSRPREGGDEVQF